MESVAIARDRIRDFLSSNNSIKKNSDNIDINDSNSSNENRCREIVLQPSLDGLGECYCLLSDLKAAEKSYSKLIKRYCLHGLLFIMMVSTISTIITSTSITVVI